MAVRAGLRAAPRQRRGEPVTLASFDVKASCAAGVGPLITRHALERLVSAHNARRGTKLTCGQSKRHGPALPDPDLPQAAVSNEISNIELGIESTDFVEGLVSLQAEAAGDDLPLDHGGAAQRSAGRGRRLRRDPALITSLAASQLRAGRPQYAKPSQRDRGKSSSLVPAP